MTIDTAEIERVVRAVLAEMDIGVRASGNDAERLPPDVVVLRRPVITLADVEGRLARARRVLVPSGAVVTPAVRDALQQRGVELQRHGGEHPAMASVAARVAMRVVSNHWAFDPLVNLLRRDGLRVAAERSDCVIESSDRLAEQLRQPGVVAVLLSSHPSMAACLANRHRGVRAVIGNDRQQTADETADVGANLLIADQTKIPLFNLKQIIADFAEGGGRPCPESVKERLG